MGKIDPSLPNRHRLHIGTSGSGKSSRIRQLLREEKPPRVIAWDPDEDFTMPRLSSVPAFVRALKGAWQSGRNYKLALTVPTSPEAFARFCDAAWLVADARRPVVVIVDELASVVRSAGKAAPSWARLSSRGRKYGVILWAGTQRPQEIDKTLFGNVNTLWCGRLKTQRDRKLLAEEMDVSMADLAGLGRLEYLERSGADAPVRGTVKLPGKRR